MRPGISSGHGLRAGRGARVRLVGNSKWIKERILPCFLKVYAPGTSFTRVRRHVGQHSPNWHGDGDWQICQSPAP